MQAIYGIRMQAIYGIRTWSHVGDNAILTGAVRNVKAAYPELRLAVPDAFPELWAGNPDVEGSAPTAFPERVRYGIGFEKRGEKGNMVEGMTSSLCDGLRLERCRCVTRTPVLYLTDEEMERSGEWNGRWLLNANCQTTSRSKGYPYWQRVVDALGGLDIYQIGGNDGRDISPDLRGVVDWRGRSGLRDLVVMAYGCEGIISPPSAITNIGAAFGKRQVVVNGSREPDVLTDYPNAVHVSRVFGPCGCGVGTGCMARGLCGSGGNDCRRPGRDGRWCQCMEELPFEEIVEAVRRLIQ